MDHDRANFVVLCEDLTTYDFIHRYLVEQGLSRRNIHPNVGPPGGGSGEAYVREQYASEVRRLRSQTSQYWLIVGIDADTGSTQTRRNQLDEALSAAGVPPRAVDDRIVVLVPKHSIETWIKHLCTDEAVDEDEPKGYKRDADCGRGAPIHRAVNKLRQRRAERRQGKDWPHCPPSLEAAQPEFDRLDT